MGYIAAIFIGFGIGVVITSIVSINNVNEFQSIISRKEKVINKLESEKNDIRCERNIYRTLSRYNLRLLNEKENQIEKIKFEIENNSSRGEKIEKIKMILNRTQGN